MGIGNFIASFDITSFSGDAHSLNSRPTVSTLQRITSDIVTQILACPAKLTYWTIGPNDELND
jgi:hypothetical protein